MLVLLIILREAKMRGRGYDYMLCHMGKPAGDDVIKIHCRERSDVGMWELRYRVTGRREPVTVGLY